MNRLTFVMTLGFGILALSAQLAVPHQSLGFSLPDDVLAQLAQTRNALQNLALPASNSRIFETLILNRPGG